MHNYKQISLEYTTRQTTEQPSSCHHRQRGSDCTVLTATGLVNGQNFPFSID